MSGCTLLPKGLRDRIDLYERAVALHRDGQSNSRIGSALGVSRDIVGYWLRGNRPKRVGRYEPDLSPSSDLAYVAGFYLGDGKDAGEEHKVRFELADREQLEYVGGLVAKILGRAPKPLGRDGAFYTVQYDSVVLSIFLNQDVEKLVEHLKDFARDFLQGFFDAEGYVTCNVDAAWHRVKGIHVGVANTDPDYLHAIRASLDALGFAPHLRVTNKEGRTMTIRGRTWVRRKNVYHLTIGGIGQVRRFRALVGFRNRTKAGKLDDLLLMSQMGPQRRFAWFTSRYRKEGRKWVRM